FHARFIAEDASTTPLTGWIHCENGYPKILLNEQSAKGFYKCAFAYAGNTGDADSHCFSRVRIEQTHERLSPRIFIRMIAFYECNSFAERTNVFFQYFICKRLNRLLMFSGCLQLIDGLLASLAKRIGGFGHQRELFSRFIRWGGSRSLPASAIEVLFNCSAFSN